MQHKIPTAYPVAQVSLESVIPEQPEPFFISQKIQEKTEAKECSLLRVAAYIRVSTENDRQEESYEKQRAYFAELLQGNPLWVSAGIYSDYGVSGTSRERRTGFQRLLRHCEEGRIDRIVTKSISRFARNTGDFLRALEVLRDNQVTIAFEKEHLDTAVVQNDLMFTAFGAIAQEESRSISANIRWGIQRHYARGEVRNVPVYGFRYAERRNVDERNADGRNVTERYADGRHADQEMEGRYAVRGIEVVEEEAAVVRRIFEEVAS